MGWAIEDKLRRSVNPNLTSFPSSLSLTHSYCTVLRQYPTRLGIILTLFLLRLSVSIALTRVLLNA